MSWRRDGSVSPAGSTSALVEAYWPALAPTCHEASALPMPALTGPSPVPVKSVVSTASAGVAVSAPAGNAPSLANRAHLARAARVAVPSRSSAPRSSEQMTRSPSVGDGLKRKLSLPIGSMPVGTVSSQPSKNEAQIGFPYASGNGAMM